MQNAYAAKVIISTCEIATCSENFRKRISQENWKRSGDTVRRQTESYGNFQNFFVAVSRNETKKKESLNNLITRVNKLYLCKRSSCKNEFLFSTFRRYLYIIFRLYRDSEFCPLTFYFLSSPYTVTIAFLSVLLQCVFCIYTDCRDPTIGKMSSGRIYKRESAFRSRLPSVVVALASCTLFRNRILRDCSGS